MRVTGGESVIVTRSMDVAWSMEIVSLMSSKLNPEKGLIFRIVHRDNVSWILNNGLHCSNSTTFDRNYVNIGNPELIDKRSHRVVPCPPGGTLSDFVPFYFTPFSPMLLNIRTGYGGITKRLNEEIVIFVSSLPTLKKMNVPFIFTDRHAYLEAAQFYSNLEKLDQIDWEVLQRRDFKRSPDDPGKIERYQAEALVHKTMPCSALQGVVCYNETVKHRLEQQISERNLQLRIVVQPGWYF
jgi:hypothetical protein